MSPERFVKGESERTPANIHDSAHQTAIAVFRVLPLQTNAVPGYRVRPGLYEASCTRYSPAFASSNL
jgi:hypothetical protein